MVALAAGSLLLGLGSSARADVAASRACRKELAIAFGSVVKTGLKGADSCHKAKDKLCTAGSDRANCNIVTSTDFDPKGKYSTAESKATTKIGQKCAAGDPALLNYTGDPAHLDDAAGTVLPLIDQTIAGNSNATEGGFDLPCDKAASKCRETIAKSRTLIINDILKNSSKCQQTIDAVSSSFGPLDSNCIMTSGQATKAIKNINKACGGLDVNTILPFVSGCSTSPGSAPQIADCVVTSAVASAQNLAKDIYSVTPPSVCGNGVVEPGEQCDDGNTTSGDGCSATCEIEGLTCTPVLTGPGATSNTHRVETVSITTPQPLGGVVIHLGYPRFEAGIPGTGGSSIVQSRLMTLQNAGLAELNDDETNQADVGLVNLNTGLASGQLFKVTYDNCVAMNQNICSRNPNVFGCCDNPADPNQFQIPPGSEICSIKGCATFKPSCTTDAQCGNIAGDCQGGTCATFKGCATFQPTCTSDAQCGGISGDCQGILCATDDSACIGAGQDNSPEFGTCVFKCTTHPPVCSNGHFPLTGAGTCDNKNGACPSNNSCQSQVGQFACSVDNPVDLQGHPVNGVTCAVNVVEAP